MMFTPCWPSAGPMGGAGVAAPAWIWSLIRPATFFLGGIVRPSCSWAPVTAGASLPRARCRSGVHRGVVRSELGDLRERQLDRGLPAEDRHEHLELLLFRADLGDRGRQGLEGPVGDGDGLAHGELDLDGRGGGAGGGIG